MHTMTVVRGVGLAMAIALAAPGAQGQVVGTFDGAGSASLSATQGAGQPVAITFTGPMIAVPTLDGVFSPIAPGSTGTIQNISVGTGTYNVPNFIQIAGYNFSLTNVAPGTFGTSSCFASTAVAGQTCTFPGTPFNLTNLSNGQGGFNLSLGFQVGGTVTTPGATSYDYAGFFTAQYTNTTFQQFYNSLQAGAAIPTSYSFVAQASVPQVTTTPEPASLAMLGTGLFGLAGFVRVRRRAA